MVNTPDFNHFRRRFLTTPNAINNDSSGRVLYLAGFRQVSLCSKNSQQPFSGPTSAGQLFIVAISYTGDKTQHSNRLLTSSGLLVTTEFDVLFLLCLGVIYEVCGTCRTAKHDREPKLYSIPDTNPTMFGVSRVIQVDSHSWLINLLLLVDGKQAPQFLNLIGCCMR